MFFLVYHDSVFQEDFGNIYVENSPQAYVQRLVPVDYGHYHDRYCEMINEELEKFAPKDREMSAVELGSSYGNTTLAYKFGLNWEKAVESWMHDDQPLKKKWDFNVVAVDISEQALCTSLLAPVLSCSHVRSVRESPRHLRL